MRFGISPIYLTERSFTVISISPITFPPNEKESDFI